jgi:hypothetical protein
MEWARGPQVLERVLVALVGTEPLPRWDGPTVEAADTAPLDRREPGFTFYRRDGRGGS